MSSQRRMSAAAPRCLKLINRALVPSSQTLVLLSRSSLSVCHFIEISSPVRETHSVHVLCLFRVVYSEVRFKFCKSPRYYYHQHPFTRARAREHTNSHTHAHTPLVLKSMSPTLFNILLTSEWENENEGIFLEYY